MTPPPLLKHILLNCEAITMVAADESLSLSGAICGHLVPASTATSILFSIFSVVFGLKLTIDEFNKLQDTWVAPLLQTYRSHLAASAFGSYEADDAGEEAGVQLQRWYRSTDRMLTLYERKDNPKLNSIFEKVPQSHFNLIHKNEVRLYAAISRLESISRSALPLNDWLLMVHYKNTSANYWRHDKWFEKLINNGVDPVSHRDVLVGLEGVAAFFKTFQIQSTVTAASLLYAFNQKGWGSFIVKPDSDHMKWRDAIQAGSQLGKYKVTGVYPEPSQSLKKVVQLEDPNLVARIFQNSLLPFVFRHSLEQAKLDIPLVDIIEVDPEGRFMIQERIDDPASAIDYVNLTWVGAEQQALLVSSVAIMKHFMQAEWCPDVALDFFRIAKNGKIKALRPYSVTHYWLEPFEKYALQVSRGNEHVYRYLMQASKIQKTTTYKCYECVVEEFAAGKEDYLSKAVVSVHVKGHYDEWKKGMGELYKQIHKIRVKAMQRYSEAKHQTIDAKKLKDAVMWFYRDSYAIAQLSSRAEDEIIKRALQ